VEFESWHEVYRYEVYRYKFWSVVDGESESEGHIYKNINKRLCGDGGERWDNTMCES